MKKLMCANWKMYKGAAEAGDTATSLLALLRDQLPPDREVIVFPPFTAIGRVVEAFAGQSQFAVGGQNFHPAVEGAFTGEISPLMLRDAGCTWALAGHSERRHIFGESDEEVGAKVAFGLRQGLSMILCVGETIAQRRAGEVEEVLGRQLRTGLAGLSAEEALRVAVAYEPVWAIGTGEVAGPQEIAAAHSWVRTVLRDICGNCSLAMPILYGGSVKPDNAGAIIALDNVDGVLVGGASLNAESFRHIVLA